MYEYGSRVLNPAACVMTVLTTLVIQYKYYYYHRFNEAIANYGFLFNKCQFVINRKPYIHCTINTRSHGHLRIVLIYKFDLQVFFIELIMTEFSAFEEEKRKISKHLVSRALSLETIQTSILYQFNRPVISNSSRCLKCKITLSVCTLPLKLSI